MNILVLGGFDLQGRTVLHDLSMSSQVKEVVGADINLKKLVGISQLMGFYRPVYTYGRKISFQLHSKKKKKRK